MKIDLHVHTCHSRRPSIWLLQKLGCPESFTDPLDCYHALKRLGMRMVTFTDHNSIEGCLAVAHLPDTFISEEITAYFPEDQCKVHVLAYDLTENDHFTIQKKRSNIYELAAFLREREISHAVAHAFSAVNGKFSCGHFEKLLLLFNVFEINGDQDPNVNHRLRQTLNALTPEDIDRLSRQHGLASYGDRPWRKRLVCGSDDHAGARFAESFTQAEDAENLTGFFAAVENGSASIHAAGTTERTFARDIYAVAYRYAKERFSLNRYSAADALLRFCDAALFPRSPRRYGVLSRIGGVIRSLRTPKPVSAEASLSGFIREQAERLIRHRPEWRRLLDDPGAVHDGTDIWFEFVNHLSNLAMADLADTFMKRLRGGQYFDLFHLLGSTGSLYLLLSPFLVAYPFYAAERRLADDITRRFRPKPAPGTSCGTLKAACFTDMFFEDNPAAHTLRRQLEYAMAPHRSLRVVTILTPGVAAPSSGVFGVAPAYCWESPDNRDRRVSFPTLLPLLDHIAAGGYTCLQAASAGPVGLVSLLIGRLLGIPVVAVYHQGFTASLQPLMEELPPSDWTWKYLAWFFNQCALVQAGSERTFDELAAHGVSRRKLRLCPAGADGQFFSARHWDQWRELVSGTDASGTEANKTDGRPDSGLAFILPDGLAHLFS